MIVRGGAFHVKRNNEGEIHVIGTQEMPRRGGTWVAMCGRSFGVSEHGVLVVDSTKHRPTCEQCRTAVSQLTQAWHLGGTP